MKSEGIGEFPNNPLELASECNSEESFHRYSDKSLHLGLIANNKKMKSHNNPLELHSSEDEDTLHRFSDNYQDENLILLKK